MDQRQSFKSSSYWARGTKSMLDPPVSKELTRVYKPANVKDVFIERDEFEASVLKMYQSVQVGTAIKLCAGTGTGKSTKLPAYLSTVTKAVGLVVMPDRAIMRHVYKYAKDTVVPLFYPSCKVVCVSDFRDLYTLSQPSVAYVAAADFLGILVNNRDELFNVGVTYVYVDEAHEPIPEYYVLRLLLTAGMLPSVKFFLGSATSTEQSMEARGPGMRVKVSKVLPKLMPSENVHTATSQSPLFHGNIVDRTLIFTNTMDDLNSMRTYYDKYSIKTYVHTSVIKTHRLNALIALLNSSKSPCVILTDKCLQTGYTIPVDTVIDCGGTEALEVNTDVLSVGFKLRRVTVQERTQRLGRVGRYMGGRAFYVDGEPQPTVGDVEPGYEVYILLWCKVLFITYTAPFLDGYEKLLHSVNPVMACALLHVGVYPLLALHYIDVSGRALGNTADVLACTCSSQKFVYGASHEVNNDLVGWVKLPTTYKDLNGNVVPLQAPCFIPSEWYPLFSLLHTAIGGSSVAEAIDELSDNESVYTVADNRQVSLRPREKSRTNRQTVCTVESVTPNLASAQFAGFKEVTPAYASRSLKDNPFSEQYKRLPDLPETRGGSGIKQISEPFAVPTSAYNSEFISARVSVGSAGSDELIKEARVNRVRLAIDKLHNQRVFPFSEDLFNSYTKNIIADSMDSREFDYMVKGKRRIAKLEDVECNDMFLLVIRIWNATITNMYQERSVSKSRFMRTNFMEVHKQTKHSCKRLFEAFQFRGLYIAVLSSARQTGKDERQHVLVPRTTAEYLLSIGNDYARAAVECVKYKIRVMYSLSHLQMGVYLPMEDLTIGVAHTFTGDEEFHYEVTVPSANVIAVKIDAKLDFVTFVHKATRMLDDGIRLRAPRPFEEVLVVTVLPGGVTRVVLGPYTVTGEEQDWHYDAHLPDGTSGSVLVSVEDGYVIGMHVGVFTEIEEKVVSTFVSAENFVEV